ncbi:MAG TPA: carbohydrate kinase family protein [candidate division Zixibacteria bacterium]|nr:carbohydrate kinase family protein [candidate division Zixibacteria bacterium]
MRIVITGSIAFDYLMSFPGRFGDHLLADQLDKVSVSFLVDSMRVQRGGVAPNIAYTNALLGGNPRIMAAAGADFEEYRVWLEENGVDTSGAIVFEDDYCASFFVNTDQDHNQIASFYTGAMARASQLTFAQHGGDPELVTISPNDPSAMVAYVVECKQSGIPYIYDPSQQIIRLSGEDIYSGINGCTMLTVNEYELSMIGEKTGLTDEEIIDMAGGLLLTLGKNGSRIYFDGNCHEIPVVNPKEISDPTGAGDAYRGGMLRGIQLGLPWAISGRMGALASTYVLENIGPQGHSYTPHSYVARYRENFDDEGALDVLLSESGRKNLNSENNLLP